MNWTINRIDDADFGCEERLPGEPLMVLVTLESELGELMQFEVADHWLELQGLDEGDEWPEEIDDITDESNTIGAKQEEWMKGYLEAISECDES